MKFTISPPKTAKGNYLCRCWGSEDGNGSYTGLYGDMHNDWSDVVWANMWGLGWAQAAGDLTSYSTDGTCFMESSIWKYDQLQTHIIPVKYRPFTFDLQLSKPKPLPKYLSLVQPFTPEVWITLIVSILIVFVAVLVIWFGNRSGEKSLGLLITNYVGIFLQQSQDHILKINNIAMRWAIQKYLGKLPT